MSDRMSSVALPFFIPRSSMWQSVMYQSYIYDTPRRLAMGPQPEVRGQRPLSYGEAGRRRGAASICSSAAITRDSATAVKSSGLASGAVALRNDRSWYGGAAPTSRTVMTHDTESIVADEELAAIVTIRSAFNAPRTVSRFRDLASNSSVESRGTTTNLGRPRMAARRASITSEPAS